MITGHAGSRHPGSPAFPIFSALASLTVGALFFALWFWLLPGWLGFQSDLGHIPRWRWLAAIPSVLGFAVALRCVWDFGCTGRGTPAPVAPPQRLVVVGFYRYVRNPMYVGFLTGWVCLWIIFGRANLAALLVALIAISSSSSSPASTKNPPSANSSAPTTTSTVKTSPVGFLASVLGTNSEAALFVCLKAVWAIAFGRFGLLTIFLNS